MQARQRVPRADVCLNAEVVVQLHRKCGVARRQTTGINRVRALEDTRRIGESGNGLAEIERTPASPGQVGANENLIANPTARAGTPFEGGRQAGTDAVPDDRGRDVDACETRNATGPLQQLTIQPAGAFGWIRSESPGEDIRWFVLTLLIVFGVCEQAMAYRLSYHPR